MIRSSHATQQAKELDIPIPHPRIHGHEVYPTTPRVAHGEIPASSPAASDVMSDHVKCGLLINISNPEKNLLLVVNELKKLRAVRSDSRFT